MPIADRLVVDPPNAFVHPIDPDRARVRRDRRGERRRLVEAPLTYSLTVVPCFVTATWYVAPTVRTALLVTVKYVPDVVFWTNWSLPLVA